MDTSLHSGSLPPSFSLVSLEPEELVISAIKKAESGEELVVRFYNTSDRQVTGKLSTFQQIEKASITNLLEETIEEIPASGNSVALSVGKHQIVTLRLNFREGSVV